MKAERTADDMTEEKDLQKQVDEDIAYGEAVWEAASYDSEQMEVLFNHLIERYMDQIEGFAKGLRVLQPYDDTVEKAELYRENVKILMEHLKGFRENGYSNEGLIEYYIRREHQEINMEADFTGVRLEIGMMEDLTRADKEDIMYHLDAMEIICAQVMTQKEKWEAMREHMVWLSGKEVTVVMKLLPLFFKIN